MRCRKPKGRNQSQNLKTGKIRSRSCHWTRPKSAPKLLACWARFLTILQKISKEFLIINVYNIAYFVQFPTVQRFSYTNVSAYISLNPDYSYIIVQISTNLILWEPKCVEQFAICQRVGQFTQPVLAQRQHSQMSAHTNISRNVCQLIFSQR